MALGRDVLDAIIREHSYRPIAGDVLVIGHQTVHLSWRRSSGTDARAWRSGCGHRRVAHSWPRKPAPLPKSPAPA